MRSFLVFALVVVSAVSAQLTEVVLSLGERVDREYGPIDATYCKVEDPNGVNTFEGFGPCQINIDRVTRDYQGIWKAQIGLSNRIITEEHDITVRTEPRRTVETSVVKIGHEIYLHCSIKTPHEFTACKFRDPHSSIRLPVEGLQEGRYSFDGPGVTLQDDGLYNVNCGMKIVEPMTSDLGLWRCAIETDHETYYSFLTVICPWAMMDPNIAAVVIAEPVVQSTRKTVIVGSEDSLTLSCDIPATLDYCYFRSPRGTTYSVSPGVSNAEFEYVGTGLDAGECGIRFNKAGAVHHGQWSCHVGLTNETAPEQRAFIQTSVFDPVSVHQNQMGSALVIVGQIRSGANLDYCRFVRSDGFGFNSRLPVEGYIFEGSLAQGFCNLRINRPTAVDYEPWTVAARISGQLQEVSGTEYVPDNDYSTPPTIIQVPDTGMSTGAIVKCVLFSLVIVILGGSLIFVLRRNRMSRKTSNFSDSFRNSFVKKEVAKTEIDVTKTAAIA